MPALHKGLRRKKNSKCFKEMIQEIEGLAQDPLGTGRKLMSLLHGYQTHFRAWEIWSTTIQKGLKKT